MIEGFGPNNASINHLLLCAANGRGVQAHSQRGVDEDNLAAFLVGAGHKAYFGMGGWSSSTSEGNAFGHWVRFGFCFFAYPRVSRLFCVGGSFCFV
jgi:hypothetical protein